MPKATCHRLLLTLAMITAAAPAQNLFANSGSAAVITDKSARNVGDILTVTIAETHSVKNEDKVERSKNTTLASSLEAFTLSDKVFKTNALPKIDVRSQQDFTGDAKQNQGSDVRASIAVIVVDVQPNGNLVVAGTRTVQVDDETKTLRISGIVRPLDVGQNNTVSSSLVADARIAILGEGANTRSVTKGPVGRLFDTLIWAAWPF